MMNGTSPTDLEIELERRLAVIEREHASNPEHRDLPRSDALVLALLTVSALAAVFVRIAL